MRRSRVIGGLGGSAAVALIGALALAIALPAGGSVALVPPAPCDDALKFTDSPLATDGHHLGTNVKAGWFSEEALKLQAVIQVVQGTWVPAHSGDDEEVAGYAFVFTVNGQARFVRLRVDPFETETYDYGTYSDTAPFFTTQGATTGLPEGTVSTDGSLTIDVPTAAMGIDPGDQLTNSFVLTYDGLTGVVPHWVDRGPGGTSPSGTEFGSDYVVGACSFVSLAAPASIKGAKTVTISGHVEPEVDDTPVVITRQGLNTLVTNTTTDATGNYSVQVPVKETTDVHATANGIDSTTRTITVRSTVTIKAIRLANGNTRIKGMTSPWLPGRVQLIKTTAFVPAATKQITGGAFSFTPRRLSPGRWQVIYTPAGGRAVRSISPAVRVR